MFNFFKRNKRYPSFEPLKQYERQHHFFIRTAEWDWMDDENIYVVDPHNPRVLTLNPWGQWIFIAANGQMTVTEYVMYMADKYKGEIPEILDQTIIDELRTLVEYGIIAFVETKQRPESRFELPQKERTNVS